MKKSARSFLPCAIGAALIGISVTANAENELIAIEDALSAAYIEKDPKAYFSHFSEDLSAFHASNPYRIDSRQVFEDGLKTFYGESSPTGLYKVQPRVQRYGDVAVVTFHFIETGHAEQGKLFAYEGKRTDVFAKQGGAWKLVHYHSSRTRKPD